MLPRVVVALEFVIIFHFTGVEICLTGKFN
jgi:hypothetical protein